MLAWMQRCTIGMSEMCQQAPHDFHWLSHCTCGSANVHWLVAQELGQLRKRDQVAARSNFAVFHSRLIVGVNIGHECVVADGSFEERDRGTKRAGIDARQRQCDVGSAILRKRVATAS